MEAYEARKLYDEYNKVVNTILNKDIFPEIRSAADTQTFIKLDGYIDRKGRRNIRLKPGYYFNEDGKIAEVTDLIIHRLMDLGYDIRIDITRNSEDGTETFVMTIDWSRAEKDRKVETISQFGPGDES